MLSAIKGNITAEKDMFCKCDIYRLLKLNVNVSKGISAKKLIQLNICKSLPSAILWRCATNIFAGFVFVVVIDKLPLLLLLLFLMCFFIHLKETLNEKLLTSIMTWPFATCTHTHTVFRRNGRCRVFYSFDFWQLFSDLFSNERILPIVI